VKVFTHLIILGIWEKDRKEKKNPEGHAWNRAIEERTVLVQLLYRLKAPSTEPVPSEKKKGKKKKEIKSQN